MKILILGARGMAGHMIASYFRSIQQIEVFATSRSPFDSNTMYLDVTNKKKLEEIIESTRPDIIINCIGVLNSFAEENRKLAFQLNSLLPHQLAAFAERIGAKLVHISTDCVFSGKEGSYTESHIPNGTTIYAESKQLGEVIDNKHLTIRTSIIGPELKDNGIGLLLWFMKQRGTIKGYQNVLWNGVTTLELAKAIHYLVENQVTGLFHLCYGGKISKYDLLKHIQKSFQKWDVEILKDEEIVLDRTIMNTRNDVRYQVPNYGQMLQELYDWVSKSEKRG